MNYSTPTSVLHSYHSGISAPVRIRFGSTAIHSGNTLDLRAHSAAVQPDRARSSDRTVGKTNARTTRVNFDEVEFSQRFFLFFSPTRCSMRIRTRNNRLCTQKFLESENSKFNVLCTTHGTPPHPVPSIRRTRIKRYRGPSSAAEVNRTIHKVFMTVSGRTTAKYVAKFKLPFYFPFAAVFSAFLFVCARCGARVYTYLHTLRAKYRHAVYNISLITPTTARMFQLVVVVVVVVVEI